MKFQSITTHSSSSTVVGKELIELLLNREISDWRHDYRDAFLELTRQELQSGGIQLMQKGLHSLSQSVVTDEGQSVSDAVAAAWDSAADDVVTVVWHGTGPRIPLDDLRDKAHAWVTHHLAEPGFEQALISSTETVETAGLLVALAAGAECAPTRIWVEAGGSAAAIMRPNIARWKALLQSAAAGSTLYVPIRRSALSGGQIPSSLDDIAAVAGLDVVADVRLISQWLRQLAESGACEPRMILAGFGYSPGASHVILQAAQDALMANVAHRVPDVHLAWLGTPTDSLLTPMSVFHDRLARHRSRRPLTKVRDALLDGLGGQLSRAPQPTEVSVGENVYSLLDCSADMQGPNYLIAKRSQRWRAMVASATGVRVAYCVTPAARTHSVLDFRILRATYRGAPRFGVVPFSVSDTQQTAAHLLLGFVHQQADATDPTNLYFERAVHGGLWRCAYEPQTIWKPATVVGWPALLKSGF